MTEKTQSQIDAEAAARAAAEAKKAQAAAAKEARDIAKKEAKEVADAAKAAAKAERAAAAAEAKKVKQAEKEAAKSQRASQPEQNGIKRPKDGTTTAKVWAICDSISEQLNQPAPFQPVLEAASADGINNATIRTQYAHWKKFNGLSGRIATPAPPQAGAAEQAAEQSQAENAAA